MKTLFSILGLLLLSSVSFADTGKPLNQVNLYCSGTVYSLSKKSTDVRILSERNGFISVINPWYGAFEEQLNLKLPQDVVGHDTLVATVKKGVDSAKEIVLEVYSIDLSTGQRQRVAFAAGEPTKVTGVSLNASTDKYETIFTCREVQ